MSEVQHPLASISAVVFYTKVKDQSALSFLYIYKSLQSRWVFRNFQLVQLL